MERERVLRLIELLKQSRATEVDVRDGDVRVRVVRACVPLAEATPHEAHEPAAPPAQTMLVHCHVVGFFRRTDESTGQPYAEPGHVVEKGQPLARIETLGKSVIVESPAKAMVIEFLAEDGQSVEYGTPLVRLKAVE